MSYKSHSIAANLRETGFRLCLQERPPLSIYEIHATNPTYKGKLLLLTYKEPNYFSNLQEISSYFSL
jgi:hypothetical protein